ncbi:CHASE3 domain-containing protein [Mesorhizobium sp. Cs1321R2N1]|uniref:CHASE3 domain-containing protein n=1 Tax=Mesorhizobium sp. Cs1321R2N1 TaxID=3015174 RepID=UPI00301BB536
MSALANLPILSKLLAAFVVVLATIFVSSAVVYDRLLVVEEAKNWRIHSTDVVVALSTARHAVLEQESNLRGYVLTGDDSFLESSRQSNARYEQLISKLRDLTKDNPSQQSRLNALDDLEKKWRSSIADREIALMPKPEGQEGARAIESSMVGRSLIDLIHAKAEEIEKAELELLAGRDATQRKAFTAAYTMTVLGCAVSLVIAALMAALVTRSIAAPIGRLTAAITTLAKGFTAVEVPRIERSDEVGKMAAAVQVLKDSMIERERLQSELAHANRVVTMGQLTASIAHEVNQPVAAVVTNAQAALRWLSGQQPNLKEAQHALRSIVNEGTRVSEVVQRIRALFMKSPRRSELLHVNSLMLEVVALTRRQVLANDAHLRLELTEGLPPIRGDRVQLQQVMLNLIINAIEAMASVRDGSRELLIRTCQAEPAAIVVEVCDTGPEMDPQSLMRLFDAFYTTKPGGLGMGLSISRTIVERHGGELSAAANEPRGAIFRFSVPAEDSAGSQAVSISAGDTRNGTAQL